MIRTNFTLIDKKPLTHNVYELVFSCPEILTEVPKPGQYALFQIAPGVSRAYSIAHFSDTTFSLILKRVTDGKVSPILCDAPISTVFSGMIPLGHFTLRENTKTKCFIGTGTGFAPLYCQMLASSKGVNKPDKVIFIFGVRNNEDIFYNDEIQSLGKNFLGFTYIPYLSQGNLPGYAKGYVTDWISRENISPYEEFYICGSPAMVKSAREKLESHGISKEQIFYEQY